MLKFSFLGDSNLYYSGRPAGRGWSGRLIQTAAENRDRQVPDPDWIGLLDNPSSIFMSVTIKFQSSRIVAKMKENVYHWYLY